MIKSRVQGMPNKFKEVLDWFSLMCLEMVLGSLFSNALWLLYMGCARKGICRIFRAVAKGHEQWLKGLQME